MNEGGETKEGREIKGRAADEKRERDGGMRKRDSGGVERERESGQ